MVEQLLAQHHRSVRQLARALGKSHQTVSNWLDGSNRPRDEGVWQKMLAFAQSGTVPPKGPVTSLNGTGNNAVPVFRTGIRYVPVGGSAHAGKPDPSMGDVEYIEMLDWGGDFDRWGKVVEGFSMADEDDPLRGLLPSDIAIIENRLPEQWHVVQAIKDGDDIIKILDKAREQFISLAPGYEPIPADGWEVLGVVIQRRRKGEQGITDIREYPAGMRIAVK